MTSNHSPAAPVPDGLAARLARLGRDGGVDDRQAVLPDPLRVFHQRLLAAFLTGTGPPDAPVVAGLAAELGLDPPAALAALAAADLVHPDPATGTIAVAYPFSGRPTPYRVELAGGPAVFAMCAIDALGIPQMLGRDGQISSVDPTSGQPITVEVHAGAWRFQPATTVVLSGRTAAGDACNRAAEWCCPYINFHTDLQAADTYRRAHADMTATLFGQAEAVQAAGQAFGGLLDPPKPTGDHTMTATQIDAHPSGHQRSIGPLGTTARVLVGGLLVASVTWGHLDRGFHLSGWLLGLVGFPALLVAGQWLLARRSPIPLRATGPVAHALNVALFLALYVPEPTSDATLLFYGASMWLAAARGYAGCEVLAVSNWLLRRDDQIGCALFWPIDQLEHHRTARRAEAAIGSRPPTPNEAMTTTDRPRPRPVIEVLYVQDCPHYPETLALVERVRAEVGIDTELRTSLIGDQAAADQARFPGSPTVRVDGRDVEPGSEPAAEYVLGCRLYRLEHRFAGQPEERWVREALLRAAGPG